MGLRVLIVDDSAAMRAYVRRTLQMAGLSLSEVHEAGDGAEAQAAVEKQYGGGGWLDLVFTDLNMPKVNGEQFLNWMRRADQYRSVPVLVISTDSTQTRIIRLRELGAQGYISKPCPPELIRMKVEQTLGRDYVPKAG